MEASILKSIKKLLNLSEDYTAFDTEIVIFINSAFSSLNQLGVGPDAAITITDEETTWDSLGISANGLGMVKTYIFLKAKLLFDPPAMSFHIEAIEKEIEQQEWRLREFHDATAAETLALNLLEEEEVIL